MSGTTDATGPEPGPEPIRYSVAAAALRLGISERAVRKRIQAGTLRAEPHGRTYWVYLAPASEPGPEGPEPGPVPLDRSGPEPGPLSRTQEATIALVQSMLAPFIVELGETREQLGRVTAERDALQGRVRELEAQQAQSPAPAAATPETATGARQKARQPRWWLRLFGIDE